MTGVDPPHHGAAGPRQLRARRGRHEDDRAVGECCCHQPGRARPVTRDHQHVQAAGTAPGVATARAGRGAAGLRHGPVGVRQSGDPGPLGVARWTSDRHGQLVRGVGRAELADEVGEVAVGERDSTPRRRGSAARRGRPRAVRAPRVGGSAWRPRPRRPGSAHRRAPGAPGCCPHRTRCRRAAARRSPGRRPGRDERGRAAHARRAAPRRAWRAPAREPGRGPPARDAVPGRTPSGRRAPRPAATPARARRTAAAVGPGRTPVRWRRALAPPRPATAPELVAAPAAPRGAATWTSLRVRRRTGCGADAHGAVTGMPGRRTGAAGPP